MAQAVLTEQHIPGKRCLFMSMELSLLKWRLSCSDGAHNTSHFDVPGGDLGAVIDRLDRVRRRLRLPASTVVFSCYEAGRDGWWIHRGLLERGIKNIVVDSSSIEVNRRSRHAKTDRIDGDKLLAMLIRHHRDHEKVWSIARCPTAEQEDARRSDRELQRLKREQTSHSNRIRSLLLLHNSRPRGIVGRQWDCWWAAHRDDVPPRLRDEIDREDARLSLVHRQILCIERQHRECVTGHPEAHPVAAALCKLRSIGEATAWRLDKQFFGWRQFNNRREVAACLGLTPTPYDSGKSSVEQGISRAGDGRMRAALVELAWSWLRYQPGSDISEWFSRRFAHAGTRMRRVGIIGVARRLIVALWHYVEQGEVPKGALLKPV